MVALSIIAAAILGGLVGFFICLRVMRNGLDQILEIVESSFADEGRNATPKQTARLNPPRAV